MALKTHDEMLVTEASIQMALYGTAGCIYVPASGSQRTITAIINYEQDEGQVQPVLRRRGPIIGIQVLNDATTGITPGEFSNGDRITVPPRKGATARNFQLARIIEQDAGMVTFEAH